MAESYRGTDDGGARSTLAGAVVRADRTVDDFVFGTCTVGGLDATGAIVTCWNRLDRPDVQSVLLGGVALAWYNIVDLERLATTVERPVLAIAAEASDGLESGIRDAFDGEAREARLDAYANLPPRRSLPDDDGRFGTVAAVRAVGLDGAAADRLLAAYTHEDRPEPVRVAKRAARRVDAFRRD